MKVAISINFGWRRMGRGQVVIFAEFAEEVGWEGQVVIYANFGWGRGWGLGAVSDVWCG